MKKYSHFLLEILHTKGFLLKQDFGCSTACFMFRMMQTITFFVKEILETKTLVRPLRIDNPMYHRMHKNVCSIP